MHAASAQSSFLHKESWQGMVCAPSLALALCCRHAFYAPRFVMGSVYVWMLADYDAHPLQV